MTSAYQVSVCTAAQEAEWDAYVRSRATVPVYFGQAWRRLVTDSLGCESHYLMARSADGSVAGVLPLMRLRSFLFGDFLVSLPYVSSGGVVSGSKAADESLITQAGLLARELGVSHVEIRERQPRDPQWPVRTDKVIMELPLEANADIQWSQMGSKLRSQIRRPEREGAESITGGAELLPDFYCVFARNMRDLGTPVYSLGFFRRILECLGGVAEIVLVRLKGIPVAAGLLVHHGHVTEIPWASANRDYNRMGVNMHLYWACIRRAIEKGAQIFDFGRSSRESGTYQFKRQWGAEPVQLHWHYWLANGRAMPGLTPDNPKFAAAVRLWKLLPVPVANVIGPHVVRHLP
jgi:serine/alanine adding enzyme